MKRDTILPYHHKSQGHIKQELMLNRGRCRSSFWHAQYLQLQLMMMTGMKMMRREVGLQDCEQQGGEHQASPEEISRLPVDLKCHLDIGYPKSSQRGQ